MSDWIKFTDQYPDRYRWIWVWDGNNFDIYEDLINPGNYTRWQYAQVPDAPNEDEYIHKCSIGSLTCFEDENGLFVRDGDDIKTASYWNAEYCFKCGYSPNHTEKPDTSNTAPYKPSKHELSEAEAYKALERNQRCAPSPQEREDNGWVVKDKAKHDGFNFTSNDM